MKRVRNSRSFVIQNGAPRIFRLITGNGMVATARFEPTPSRGNFSRLVRRSISSLNLQSHYCQSTERSVVFTHGRKFHISSAAQIGNGIKTKQMSSLAPTNRRPASSRRPAIAQRLRRIRHRQWRHHSVFGSGLGVTRRRPSATFVSLHVCATIE